MIRKISFLYYILFILVFSSNLAYAKNSESLKNQNGKDIKVEKSSYPNINKSSTPEPEDFPKPTLNRKMLTQEIGFNLLTGLTMPQYDSEGVPYMVSQLRMLSGVMLSYNFFMYHNVSIRFELGTIPIKTYELPMFTASVALRYYTPWDVFIGIGASYHYASYTDPEVPTNKLIPYYNYMMDIGYSFPLIYGNLDVIFRYTLNATDFISYYDKQFSLHILSIVVGYNLSFG